MNPHTLVFFGAIIMILWDVMRDNMEWYYAMAIGIIIYMLVIWQVDKIYEVKKKRLINR